MSDISKAERLRWDPRFGSDHYQHTLIQPGHEMNHPRTHAVWRARDIPPFLASRVRSHVDATGPGCGVPAPFY